jgi:hypothetical protein
MKKKTAFYLLPVIAGIFLMSCNKNDEVFIEPGYLVIENSSGQVFDLYLDNLDEPEKSIGYAGSVQANTRITLRPEIGYTYQVKAEENDPSGGIPEVLIEVFTITPYQQEVWNIPDGSDH